MKRIKNCDFFYDFNIINLLNVYDKKTTKRPKDNRKTMNRVSQKYKIYD